MEHVIRIPHKCHNFIRKFVTVVTLKVPSGSNSKSLVVQAGGDFWMERKKNSLKVEFGRRKKKGGGRIGGGRKFTFAKF